MYKFAIWERHGLEFVEEIKSARIAILFEGRKPKFRWGISILSKHTNG